MNRRKKINQILKKRAKQANSKVSGKKKPPYISKAQRVKLEELSHPTTDEDHQDKQKVK